MPYIIDGKAISKQIKDELRDEVEKLTEAGINACLAVIQVGNDLLQLDMGIIKRKHARMSGSIPGHMNCRRIHRNKHCWILYRN